MAVTQATTSTVPAVKAKLQSLLKAEKALHGVQVEYGYPGDTVERSSLWLSSVDGEFRVPTMKAGRKARAEDYRISVVIDVLVAGGTPNDAETKAFGYLAALEDVLADDPSLATNINAAVAGDFSSSVLNEHQGASCRLQITVSVSSRLA